MGEGDKMDANNSNSNNNDIKCVRGNRCVKCRKINLKREVKLYQKLRSDILESNGNQILSRISSACGIPDPAEACRVILDLINLSKAAECILITPQHLQSLLNQRAKIGRLRRGIQNKIEKEKAEAEAKAAKKRIKTKHIKYDSHNGVFFPDALIENAVQKFFESDDPEITVGQELFIYFARAYSRTHPCKLVLWFEGTSIEVIDGRCSEWPQGFCGNYDKALDKLLS